MAEPRKSRSFLQQEVHTAEFTSGQLVLGICGLLVVAMFCFAMGILLERWQNQRHLRENQIATVDQSLQTPAERSQAAGAPPSEVRVRELPAPPPAEPAKTTEKPVETSGNLPDIQTAKAANTEEDDTAQTQVASVPPEKEEAGTEEPREPEKTPTQPEETPEITQVASAKPASDATPAETPRVSTAPAADSGQRYTVQLAAYKRRAIAESAVERLKANTKLQPELTNSNDGQWIYLWVGDYSSEAEAIAARDELRKRAQFKDCVVKPRP